MKARYIVAKANRTARPFVARIERYQESWIVLGEWTSYIAACQDRDRYINIDNNIQGLMALEND